MLRRKCFIIAFAQSLSLSLVCEYGAKVSSGERSSQWSPRSLLARKLLRQTRFLLLIHMSNLIFGELRYSLCVIIVWVSPQFVDFKGLVKNRLGFFFFGFKGRSRALSVSVCCWIGFDRSVFWPIVISCFVF